jgi:hypothetical protein
MELMNFTLTEMFSVLDYFNLIATTFRHREKALIKECLYLLSKTGDSNAQFHSTNIPGIVTGITDLDPFLLAKNLRELSTRDSRISILVEACPCIFCCKFRFE